MRLIDADSIKIPHFCLATDRIKMMDAIDDAPTIEPSEWIPTSVRMPSENGKYLCCWQGKSVETGMFLNGHFRLYGEIKDNLVTAWMPLPKPYGEREGE